jgi:serine-type D-Ala-D-Ala carboxypeptidase/endopeptidase (penicillin-binding protein 4)
MKRLLFVAALSVAVVGCKSGPSSTTRKPSNAPSHTPTTQAVALRAKLDEILNRHREKGAFVVARVIDPTTGEELFAQDADRAVIPASNMKLPVTAAALDVFGADATFETDLMVVGNDLWLVGRGDPATGDDAIEARYKRLPTSVLNDWADELIARGLTQFSGNLYYYDGVFERLQTHPSWGEDLTEWYAAPVGGLNFNDNCIDATASPTKPGEPVKLDVMPATTASVVIVNQATTGTTLDIDWSRAPTQNVYTVKGTLAPDRTKALQSKPVTDPGAFFADALRTHLAGRGIKIAGATLRGDVVPTGTVTKLKPATTRLVDILDRVNTNSQNLLAEGLAKLLGLHDARRAGEANAIGSWAGGDRAIRAFLARNNIDASGFAMADGSGLSRDNRVTARLISDLLLTMYRRADFELYRKSMTNMGVAGTTSKRLKDKPNRVFAKTGFISGVRALSGYVKTDSGKWLIFSFIYNGITPRGIEATKPYEDLQDEALRVLMAR